MPNWAKQSSPALHGLLNKVRDLGLPLLAVNQIKPGEDNPLTTA